MEQSDAARGAAASRGHARRGLRWIDFHTGLGPRGHGEKIYNGRAVAADIARARDWWGADVTSFLDGTSTSAPLVGINGNAIVRRMPRRRRTRGSRSNTARFRCARRSRRCAPTIGCTTIRSAPAALRAAIRQQMRDAFYTDADDWKAQVYAQARDGGADRAGAARAAGQAHERFGPPSAPISRRHRSGRVATAAWHGDVAWSFRHSPVAVVSTIVLVICLVAAVFAPWLAPHNPFDLRTLNLSDAFTPPAWLADGKATTCSAPTTRGATCCRRSCSARAFRSFVGAVSVAARRGRWACALGLIAGYAGGKLDAFIMRVADVQLSFPAILIALLIDGVARAVLPRDTTTNVALFVLVLAIAAANWVQYARTVRGSTMVEKSREYVQAARVIGISPLGIMRRHLLPNVLGPVLVLGTINIATAIITEATLSFLGVGMPPTQPSLGTLINVGQEFLLSGEWWITIFPGVALVIMVLAINLLGDWMRDALNPKLR